MRFIFTVFTLSLSFNLWAQPLEMLPGQWFVDVEVEQGGKMINVSKKIEESLKNLPPERRAMFEKMMQGQGGAGPGIAALKSKKVCYTKAMIRDPKNINPELTSHCPLEIKKQTKDILEGAFKCKDGAKGTIDLRMQGKKSYTTMVNGEQKDGKKFKAKMTGKFVKEKC